MKKLSFIVALFLFIGVYFIIADIIVFKNGNQIKVKDLKINKKSISYKVDGFPITIPLDSIDLKATRKANKTKIAHDDNSIAAQREKLRKDLNVKKKQEKIISPLSQLSHKIMNEKEIKEYIKKWAKKLPQKFKNKQPHTAILPKRIDFTIPFRRHRSGLLLISGLINHTFYADFVFDTGASITTLSINTATDAGVEFDQTHPFRVNTAGGLSEAFPGIIGYLKIGDLVISNIHCLVTMDSNINLIGQNIMSYFTVTLDNKREVIILTLKNH